jgi:regulator of replication initiation timing
MESFEKLEEKITRAITLIEKLNEDNKRLADENRQLKLRLSETEKRLALIEKGEVEKAEKIKEKLGHILGKLEILEQV